MVRRSSWIFGISFDIFLILLSSINIAYALENPKQSLQNPFTDFESYNNTEKSERSIFFYRKNGVKLDIRLVRGGGDDSKGEEADDRFPMLPVRDLGHCAIDMSTACLSNRIARYIQTVSGLDRITLFGSTIKFVKVREPQKQVFIQRGMNSVDTITRSINDFFDKFALRITLPGWNKRKEQNQIDFMFDDNDLTEGRGKGHHKRKGGDEYKQMMMCMMIALKMNVMGMMGLAMFKGMMMSGISMLMTKAMLVMKLMEWLGGSSSTGKVEKILLVTKASGDDGGGWHGPPSHSIYGGPPSSSNGGGHHGGGWGRSFNNPLPMRIISTSAKINNQELTNNDLSIINTYPETNRNNYPRHIDNEENIGEIYQRGAISKNQHYSNVNNRGNKKLTDLENKL